MDKLDQQAIGAITTELKGIYPGSMKDMATLLVDLLNDLRIQKYVHKENVDGTESIRANGFTVGYTETGVPFISFRKTYYFERDGQ